MLPQITVFSDGYYMMSNIYIEPVDNEVPGVEEHLYGYIQSEVYEGSQTPIMMKHSQRHFEVEPRDDVPIDVLAVPEDEIDSWDIDAPPSREQVLLAKPETAHRMGQAIFFDYPTDEETSDEDYY